MSWHKLERATISRRAKIDQIQVMLHQLQDRPWEALLGAADIVNFRGVILEKNVAASPGVVIFI